jgi:cystathionine gamma-synthase
MFASDSRTMRSSVLAVRPALYGYSAFFLSSSARETVTTTTTGTTETVSTTEDRGSRPLGSPLPEDEHACSVSLPTWSSVVGYEEGDPLITKALKCGYPRFVYHPYVLRLMETVLERHGVAGEDCLVLPSAAAAVRCQTFLQEAIEGNKRGPDNALLEGATITSNDSSTASASASTSRVRAVSLGAADVHAVLFPAETVAGMEAKAYWQHTGEVVSSRRAECAVQELGVCLKSQHVTCGPTGPICHSSFRGEPAACLEATASSVTVSPEQQLKDRIAGWAKVPSGDIFLSPSGMASIYMALRSARRYHLALDPDSKGGESIVFGFPYLDTLKMCSRSEFCPAGVEFFGKGNAQDLHHLEKMLETGRCKPSVLITEVPSNPLLLCPDLFKLRELADKYNFFLVVDDTISTFLNVNLIESGLADAVCSSLTKLVSGRGDVMGGSLVANASTEKGRWMQQDLASLKDPTHGGLYKSDAVALLKNSVDFPERSAVINTNAEGLADWLQEHPDVQTVYYPKSSPHYAQVQSESGGFGGLFSIILHRHMCQRTFYDALDVAKGPSLGTNFTLVCPYTLLAHYHELDFAMSYNVPPNLLRVAVGMEPLEVLQSKFETAFSTSRLYPKPTMQMSTTLSDSVTAATTSTTTTSSASTSQQSRSYSSWAGAMPMRKSPLTGQSQWRRSAQLALRQLVHLR